MFQIVKHGGTLVPSYDPTIITHIVTDATTRPTLRALGLTSLKSIPNHIPTVRWSWVISGYGRSGHKKHGEAVIPTKGKGKAVDGDNDDASDLDFEFLHAAFPERIDAGRSWLKKGKAKLIPPEGQISTSANEHDGDSSRISYVHSRFFSSAGPLGINIFLARLLNIQLKINKVQSLH